MSGPYPEPEPRRSGTAPGQTAGRARALARPECVGRYVFAGCYRETVYFTNSRGVLRSLELGTGKSRWATRLASAAWATPIVNGDRIYIFGTDGVASIFATDAAEPIELARIPLTVSERVYGVAAVDGALLVRTGGELIRIGSGPHP